MATHSSILAWEIPWTEEPSRLQSLGPKRIGLSNNDNSLLDTKRGQTNVNSSLLEANTDTCRKKFLKIIL